MRNIETLYTILNDAEDLLRGKRVREHPALMDRVTRVMQISGGNTAETVSPGKDRMGLGVREDRSARDEQAIAREGGSGVNWKHPVSSAQDREVNVPGEDLSPEIRRERLDALIAQVNQCTRCPLSLGRTNAVAGEGVLDPLVMFVGEGPGADEDARGCPFVGAAGQYLDRWLAAIGLNRETNAYITNIVKCRPPNNRDPQPEESDACLPWLREQIALVRPTMIVTLGRISMRVLTGTTKGITRTHGTFYTCDGIPLVPTFHPSAVLRREEWRRPVWEDLKTIRNWLVDNAGHAVLD